jgi:hypothetical protein
MRILTRLAVLLFALAWPAAAAAQVTTPTRFIITAAPCWIAAGTGAPSSSDAPDATCAIYIRTNGSVYTKPASSSTWTLVIMNGGALGTPSSGTLTNATGLPIGSGVSGLGTGVATALAVNVGSSGAFVANGGALGTPSSGTATNLTGLPPAGVTFAATDRFLCRDTASGGAGEECTGAAAAGIIGLSNILGLYTGTPTGSKFLRDDGSWQTIPGGGDALTANPLSQFAATTLAQFFGVISNEASGLETFSGTPSCANFAALVTGETGSCGSIVLSTSPQFTTSVTTDSTTFALFNTTATTVNAFGAATTVNTGASATQIWNFGGSTTASEFRFLEPSGSGTNYTGFKAQAMAGNNLYTLPASQTANGLMKTDGSGALSWTTDLPAGTTFDGDTLLSLTAVAQGDIIYGTGTNTIDVLAKNTSATRYLSNTGTSNNPAWAQVDLTNGVTGDLPFANLAQGSALSVLGVTGNATADNASIAAGSDHQVLRRSGTAVAFGSIDLAQSAAVTGTLAVGNGGTGITAFGTGVATALGVNVGSSGAFVTNGGALGTPSSGTATNITGLPPAGVTFAASDRILCRDTASGGAGEECTAANVLAMANLVFSGPTTPRTYTLPDANATILTTAMAPIRFVYNAANCQGTTATIAVGTFTADAPTAECFGTNVRDARLIFPDTTALTEVQGSFMLPASFSSIIARIKWSSSGTGNVVPQLWVACTANDEAANDTWVSTTPTTSAQLTANDDVDYSLTLTTTGCAGDERLNWRLGRENDHGSDTLSATWRVMQIVFEVVR